MDEDREQVFVCCLASGPLASETLWSCCCILICHRASSSHMSFLRSLMDSDQLLPSFQTDIGSRLQPSMQHKQNQVAALHSDGCHTMLQRRWFLNLIASHRPEGWKFKMEALEMSSMRQGPLLPSQASCSLFEWRKGKAALWHIFL